MGQQFQKAVAWETGSLARARLSRNKKSGGVEGKARAGPGQGLGRVSARCPFRELCDCANWSRKAHTYLAARVEAYTTYHDPIAVVALKVLRSHRGAQKREQHRLGADGLASVYRDVYRAIQSYAELDPVPCSCDAGAYVCLSSRSYVDFF